MRGEPFEKLTSERRLRHRQTQQWIVEAIQAA
jgi:hypothetical protein